jgi:hypothetical protein
MRVIDLLDLPASPTIAGADGRTVFSLSARGHVELFSSFADRRRLNRGSPAARGPSIDGLR